MRRWPYALAVLVVVVAAACSSSSSSSAPTSSSVKTVRARPAGVTPSKSAQMVCAPEAQKDIRQALGVAVSTVTTPTWVDHVYSCSYVYPTGTVSVSVKELDGTAQTKSYFDQLRTQLGRRPGNFQLGQGAFITTNGSLVTRKDWKVLLVDVSKMPAQFGQPPLGPSDVASVFGVTLMGCWTGA